MKRRERERCKRRRARIRRRTSSSKVLFSSVSFAGNVGLVVYTKATLVFPEEPVICRLKHLTCYCLQVVITVLDRIYTNYYYVMEGTPYMEGVVLSGQPNTMNQIV